MNVLSDLGLDFLIKGKGKFIGFGYQKKKYKLKVASSVGATKQSEGASREGRRATTTLKSVEDDKGSRIYFDRSKL